MKKLAMAMMLGVAALSANAQVNYRMQTACNPQDVKTYDTQRLRSSFMMEKVLVADEIIPCTTVSSLVVPCRSTRNCLWILSTR